MFDAALDDPVGSSLRGRHAHLGRRVGGAATYAAGVATFCALDDGAPWSDLAEVLGPGGFADMFSSPLEPPAGWEPVFTLPGRQMIHDGVGYASSVADGPDVVQLTSADVPAMLDLIERTGPGPFGQRTIEMGTYLGVVVDGSLVAMAGERLSPPGWTEISAVCTVPEMRGRGYAAHLVTALGARITARGDLPFLHVAESNYRAIGVYERLGYRTRRHVTFRGFRTP